LRYISEAVLDLGTVAELLLIQLELGWLIVVCPADAESAGFQSHPGQPDTGEELEYLRSD
jgi:hypothetical protein